MPVRDERSGDRPANESVGAGEKYLHAVVILSLPMIAKIALAAIQDYFQNWNRICEWRS
jgi:hypothetical protein